MVYFRLAGVLLILGGILLIEGWTNWETEEVAENTPRSTVRSIAIGQVELGGIILTDEPIDAPLSGEQCVYYHYEIERRERRQYSHWVTVDEDTDHQRAWLRDKTGQVPVDLDGVTVKNSHEFEEKSNWFSDPSKDLQRRLDELDVEWEGLFDANLTMRYREQRIEHGDNVYLLGTARDNPNVEDGTAQQGHKDIMIVEDDNEFILALGDEEDLRDTAQTKARWQIGLGTTATILGLAALLI